LRAPLLISCMTGGTDEATRINRHLARAAEATGVALGVGSQRKAIEEPALADSFRVRDVAPTMPLLANLGAVQLNYGYG
ncbi:MAG: type 2 isopentenyl-diphosphate Delta-isomerase, partial [Gammaproteobacteria bacterium]|nr:type 2 isopentenyl-diphosphate Delta-isomerase [Gammaproteobacteria bacterium]